MAPASVLDGPPSEQMPLAEGVAALVELLALQPCGCESADDGTPLKRCPEHSKATGSAAADVHLWYRNREGYGCDDARAVPLGDLSILGLDEDPAGVTCRLCLAHGHYRERSEAAAALATLTGSRVEADDPRIIPVSSDRLDAPAVGLTRPRRCAAWGLAQARELGQAPKLLTEGS